MNDEYHGLNRRLWCISAAFLLTVFALAMSSPARAMPIDDAHKWAWGTSAGWINHKATHGQVAVYADHLEGYAWAENVGWVRLGTYSGGEAHTYLNTAANNYGVNNDGAGNLSGFGWSTNAGWINFSPSHGGVTIDLATGDFSGYAWSENAGWIKLAGTAQNSTPYKVKTDPTTYTVTYKPNGATSGTVPADQTKTHDVDLTLATNSGNLAKTGYTFVGWNTAADGLGTPYGEGALYTSNADLTLYASWGASKYTVTFDANGGTTPVPATKQVHYGETYGDLATTTREGYTFNGWFTAATGGTQVTSATTVSTAANHTLYAQWTINNYTLTTAVNPAAIGTVTKNPDQATYTYGTNVQLTATANAGYTFTGWSGDLTGTTNPASITMDGNKTVTANFLFTRYVCSDGLCGGKSPCHTTISGAVTAASTGTLIKIAAETQDGGFSLNADKSLTLQGGWDKSFNNPNGGTTTLQGAPKAPQGSLTFQNLRIVP